MSKLFTYSLIFAAMMAIILIPCASALAVVDATSAPSAFSASSYINDGPAAPSPLPPPLVRRGPAAPSPLPPPA
ncbi:MAG: hypothetical protein WBW03_14170, partial [Silvibacterium sp.]